ncbi:glyoxalase domain-containing protein 4-like [Tubulanus polymorphus]|uniref:glyoxalase domain-containing protein 4-like n=1 Tax=Tubulanus polymorphus TaxID=672921 RepID=UPI003DA57752
MSSRRALHFVFKIGDRSKTVEFFKNVLGMKFLRHEEFEEGCKASCNGPYDGKWSKSMVGYGPEDNHFVIELTYNYGIGSYLLGNDFRGITIHSKEAVENAKSRGWPFSEEDGIYTVEAPGGYKFHLHDKDSEGDPVKMVSLASANLQNSLEYWVDRLGMNLYDETEKQATVGFSEEQCKLEFVDIGKKVDHAKAFGRIAFSVPKEQLPTLEHSIKGAGYTILTPLVSLDTPGKATVQVVILADPDQHEICFVGDEAFRELSVVDPEADRLLQEALEADKSDEWFAKKGQSKADA